MLSGSCHFAYKGNPQLPRHGSRIPASAFSTVLVRTPCDFLGHGSERSATTRCRRNYYWRGELQSQLKRVKHNYTYYLLVITQLSFEYLHAVTRYLFLKYVADLHAFAEVWQSKIMLRRPILDDRHFGLVHNAVSCTRSELTMLVDTQQSPHTVGCTQDALFYSSTTVSNKVARTLKLTLLKRSLLELWIGFQTVWDFSCTRSSSHLNIGHVPIYNNGEFVRGTFWRYPRCDVTDSMHILMLVGKVYYNKVAYIPVDLLKGHTPVRHSMEVLQSELPLFDSESLHCLQQNLSNTNTLGTQIIVLFSGVSLFQGENDMLQYLYKLGTQ